MNAASNKGKDRPPINPAELSKRFARLLVAILGIDRGENDAPASGVETATLLRKVGGLARAHDGGWFQITSQSARKNPRLA